MAPGQRFVIPSVAFIYDQSQQTVLEDLPVILYWMGVFGSGHVL